MPPEEEPRRRVIAAAAATAAEVAAEVEMGAGPRTVGGDIDGAVDDTEGDALLGPPLSAAGDTDEISTLTAGVAPPIERPMLRLRLPPAAAAAALENLFDDDVDDDAPDGNDRGT